MASIEKRGERKYKIVVTCGITPEGKRIRKMKMFTPSESAITEKQIRKEVERAAVEFETLIEAGRWYEGEKMLFKEFVAKWDSGYAAEHISESVLDGYRRRLELDILPHIGNIPIGKITPLHLQDLYSGLSGRGLKASSVKRVHAIISGIFSVAIRWGVICDSPCKRVEMPRKERDSRVHTFTVDQTKLFIRILTGTKSVPLQFQIYYILAIYSGMRRGEEIALTWNDINTETHEVKICKAAAFVKNKQIIKEPKTRAGYRTITIPLFVCHMLLKWRHEQIKIALSMGEAWEGKPISDFGENWIFIQANGKQMHMSTPTHKFREIIDRHNDQCKEAEKLPMIRLHDLRHTSATLMISSGVDVRTAANRLGHSSPSLTLNVYAEALRSADQAAANTLESLIG